MIARKYEKRSRDASAFSFLFSEAGRKYIVFPSDGLLRAWDSRRSSLDEAADGAHRRAPEKTAGSQARRSNASGAQTIARLESRKKLLPLTLSMLYRALASPYLWL